MDRDYDVIARAAAALAFQVPAQTLDLAASAIEACSQDEDIPKGQIAQSIPHPHYRGLLSKYLAAWREHGGDLPPSTVALALRTAAHARRAHEQGQSVELVWTGPEAEGVSFRRTEQAILQVLDSAETRITLVSYAVYRIPHVRDALVRAAGRGVRVRVIVERGDKAGSQIEYDTLRSLGTEVAACSTVYYWPEDQRRQQSGKTGSLHVKCAISDGRCLLISSANLTEYAFTLNMELGVLITGGDLPRRVEERFGKLIEKGSTGQGMTLARWSDD